MIQNIIALHKEAFNRNKGKEITLNPIQKILIANLRGTRMIPIKSIIKPSNRHRNIEGAGLYTAREKAGLTQEQFALSAGYSQAYQYLLELPGDHEITIEVALKITDVLIESGISRL